MNKQIQRLDDWFLSGKTITDTEASKYLSIGKFSARITEMRQAGYPIESVWERGKNQFGEATRYKRYFYDEEQRQQRLKSRQIQNGNPA